MNEAANAANVAFGPQMGALLPYLLVAGGGLLIMLVDSFVKTLRKDHLAMLAILALLGTVIALAWPPFETKAGTLLGGMLLHQDFTTFFGFLFLGIAMLTTTFATGAFDQCGVYRADFYPLLFFAVLGMMVLVAANDLLVLFLGLECMSLATYVLVGGRRRSIRSSEAGFKYLILGGFSSAFLLAGMALFYGYAGSTSLDVLGAAVAQGGGEVLWLNLGTGLLLIGMGFKIAMVPFHMWTPDVYDGAPAYVTGFMATGIKAAGMAILLRMVWILLPVISEHWAPLLTVLAVLTMTIGNLIALAQHNIKRVLAYSSIAHAGYLLLGVLAIIKAGGGSLDAVAMMDISSAAGGGMFFYLVGYSIMNIGAFGIVALLGKSRERDADHVARYAGLSRRNPLAAACLSVFLFGLAGIPPTIGFMGKLYVFEAVVRAGLLPLAIWGVINSLISVYYYLRIIVVMYMKDSEEDGYDGTNWETRFACTILAFLTLLLGVMPGALHRLATDFFRSMVF